jgi:hypothetical protein
MMRLARARRMIVHMTLSEHIEQNSFAYCAELPPDVAEGLPLTAALHDRQKQPAPLKRALQTWVRVVKRRS